MKYRTAAHAVRVPGRPQQGGDDSAASVQRTADHFLRPPGSPRTRELAKAAQSNSENAAISASSNSSAASKFHFSNSNHSLCVLLPGTQLQNLPETAERVEMGVSHRKQKNAYASTRDGSQPNDFRGSFAAVGPSCLDHRHCPARRSFQGSSLQRQPSRTAFRGMRTLIASTVANYLIFRVEQSSHGIGM